MSTLYINRKTKRSCVTVAAFPLSAYANRKAQRKAAASERLRLQMTEGCDAVQFLAATKADSAWLKAEQERAARTALAFNTEAAA